MRRFLSALFFVSALAVISSSAQQRYISNLTSAQVVPPVVSTRSVICSGVLRPSVAQPGTWELEIRSTFQSTFPAGTNISVHRAAPVGQNSQAIFTAPLGQATGSWFITAFLTPQDLASLRANHWYLLVSTPEFPSGELRGQIKLANGTYNDYDGDGRTDVQVYRTSTNRFYALSSLNGSLTEVPLGQAGDSVSLTVDFDGDGLSDFSTARYNAEVLWRIRKSTTGQIEETRWGSSSLGDFFASADYDGDGKFDIAVFRAGVWYIIESSTGTVRYDFWGTSGDAPAPNDYDGDGKADLTIARSDGGQRIWWTKFSSNSQTLATAWGLSSDAFFTGRSDFDGDSLADHLVIRNVSGQRIFYILQSSNGVWQVIPWGLSSDVVKLGDYDGDGKTDPAVTRAVNGQRVFYILQSSNGQARYETFGIAGDF
jgi:hypothetical protein